MALDCVFCKIASGEIKAEVVYEDERAVAFNDMNPAAPVHFLVIPRSHVRNLNEASEENEVLLGHLLRVIDLTARKLGAAESGYRVVANTNRDAGQEVMHLHFHVLGKRKLTWPPG